MFILILTKFDIDKSSLHSSIDKSYKTWNSVVFGLEELKRLIVLIKLSIVKAGWQYNLNINHYYMWCILAWLNAIIVIWQLVSFVLLN